MLQYIEPEICEGNLYESKAQSELILSLRKKSLSIKRKAPDLMLITIWQPKLFLVLKVNLSAVQKILNYNLHLRKFASFGNSRFVSFFFEGPPRRTFYAETKINYVCLFIVPHAHAHFLREN